MEAPEKRGLVQKFDMVGGRNAAECFHGLPEKLFAVIVQRVIVVEERSLRWALPVGISFLFMAITTTSLPFSRKKQAALPTHGGNSGKKKKQARVWQIRIDDVFAQ